MLITAFPGNRKNKCFRSIEPSAELNDTLNSKGGNWKPYRGVAARESRYSCGGSRERSAVLSLHELLDRGALHRSDLSSTIQHSSPRSGSPEARTRGQRRTGHDCSIRHHFNFQHLYLNVRTKCYLSPNSRRVEAFKRDTTPCSHRRCHTRRLLS